MTSSLRRIETLVAGLSYTEAPRWHNGRLWFADFYTYRVLTVSLDNPEQVETVADIPEQPSGIGFLPDGDALIVSMRDRRLIRRSSNGALSEYADLSALVSWHGYFVAFSEAARVCGKARRVGKGPFPCQAAQRRPQARAASPHMPCCSAGAPVCPNHRVALLCHGAP